MLVAQAEATVKDMENLQQTALIIAVVQSVIIVPAFVAVMYFHIFRLNQHRRALFSVFLGVPRHVAMR